MRQGELRLEREKVGNNKVKSNRTFPRLTGQVLHVAGGCTCQFQDGGPWRQLAVTCHSGCRQ
jgi:hypothetical protein